MARAGQHKRDFCLRLQIWYLDISVPGPTLAKCPNNVAYIKYPRPEICLSLVKDPRHDSGSPSPQDEDFEILPRSTRYAGLTMHEDRRLLTFLTSADLTGVRGNGKPAALADDAGQLNRSDRYQQTNANRVSY